MMAAASLPLGSSRPNPRGLALALGIAYGYRLGAAGLLALPIVQAVRAAKLPHFPQGDRLLLESGGLYLLELLQQSQALLRAQLGSTFWLLLLFAFSALIPQWLLLRALRTRAPTAALSSDAARELPALALLGALTWIARASLLVAALALAATLRSYFIAAQDERLPDLAFIAGLGLALLPQLGLSMWHDLASATVVERGVAMPLASGAALRGLRQRGLPLLTRYLGVQLSSLALLVGCGVLVDVIDVAQPGAWRSLLAIGAHQLVVLGCMLLHAYWLFAAVRASAPAEGAPSGHGRAQAQADAFL